MGVSGDVLCTADYPPFWDEVAITDSCIGGHDLEGFRITTACKNCRPRYSFTFTKRSPGCLICDQSGRMA